MRREYRLGIGGRIAVLSWLAVSMLFGLLGQNISLGQDLQEQVPDAEAAEDSSDPLGERQSLHVATVGGPAGLKAYVSGRWGLVGAMVTNRTDEEQVVEATVMVGDNETLRFSRNIVVPAKTTRSTTIPVHIPAGLEGAGPIRLIGRAVADEMAKPLELDFLARLLSPHSIAFIDDSAIGKEKPVYGFDFDYESTIALRVAMGMDRRLLPMNTRLLPASIEGWDAIDIVVLASNRTSASPAARQALRQWLSEGGKMWIHLNSVSPEAVRELLGSALEFEVVDRVELNEFEISFARRGSLSEPFPVSVEEPIEFIRSFVEDAEVLYEVDQWPAMFRIPFGRGEVYFTTLAGRGWVRPRNSEDPAFSDPLFYTDFMPSAPLREMATMLRERAPELSSETDKLGQFVTSRVGYEIPGRGLVVGLLLAFCGFVGGAAVFLGKFEQREKLGWCTVGGGMVTAGLISFVGWNSKKDIPPTASSLQIVEMLPESGEYVSEGYLAVFNADTQDASMGTDRRTRIDPQSKDLSGKIRKFVWSDATRWRWRGTELPPGMQVFRFDAGRALESPVVANGTFSAEGLAGKVNFEALYKLGAELNEGGVIVFPHAVAMAANLSKDGSFNASNEDALATGQYFNSQFISDSQRRQQAIYDKWYSDYMNTPDPSPYLLAWMDNLGTDLNWPEDVTVRDASLVAIPLMLRRDEDADEIAIPGSAISMRAVLSDIGQSSVFDNAKQSWNYPSARSSITRIRFQLPASTLPLVPKQATLEIDCNIPSRTLEFSVIEGDQTRVVATRKNASGKLSIELNENDLPQTDELGGVTLEFTVGDLERQVEEETMSNSAWSIRSTRLSVIGIRAPTAQD